MNSDEIVRVCQQLADEKKVPTVALVKARLVNAAPLPVIISGIKRYKSNPNARLDSDEVIEDITKQSKASLEQRVADLEALVMTLQSEINALKIR